MVTEKDLSQEELTVQTDEKETEETVENKLAEEPAQGGAETSTAPSVEQLQSELEEACRKTAELEAKLEETENRMLRLQADFDNSRRRARLDLAAAEKYRAQSLLTDLLPAIDNFERALKMEADNEQAKAILQGMEMVYRSLLDAMKKEGLEPIEATGKEFDPNFHQAVMQAADPNFESNIVVDEFQKGYVLKDRVIRPAMVKVNQ
ncbi:nucleotide exchange factor GrpE [Bacillus benzoevorans]|uniref:Protein GrpE n=1 Tax=Bacillus benzoevorans TaxID=1456 RepID=A0A7X0HUU3_9BACI|nr:nucleotide exchange factor GrpE [Bacillus benzoevorans]MBB6445971.1 molecular chaperone GrpE [Bacillus benzoevorans]